MVQFGKNGIFIDRKEVPLYSGAVHYWRIERENWEKVLDGIKNIGFDMVETYIPWSIHEISKGIYDFGEGEEKRDLDGFLELCKQKNLWVIVRPGPHINAEMTLFGYPEWILADEKIQAKTPQGTPVIYPYVTKQFAVPSYASKRLFRETEGYFTVLQPLLEKHSYPKGNIIAIQADNETCYFFRDRPYVMDYSEDSIELYRQMLKIKYHTAENISSAYGKTFSDFAEICPPIGYDNSNLYAMEYYYDWAEYKEFQILYALEQIVKIIEKMKLNIPIFHNCAYQNYTPISLQRIEQISGLHVAGIDAYPEPNDSEMLKQRIRYLAGSSRLPFVPEFGSGSWFDRGQVLSAKEEEFGYLYAFMNGMKAVNFYMIAERERWTGCPITSDGRTRESYKTLFTQMLNMLKQENIYQYQRTPRVLILRNYDMGRLKACTSKMDLNTLSSNLFIQGPDIPSQLFESEAPRNLEKDTHKETFEENWIVQVMNVLDSMHIEYDISDCYVEQSKLNAYTYVFASSYRQMSGAYQQLLHEFVRQADNKYLFLGPTMPIEDRKGLPCCILENSKWECDRVQLMNEVTEKDLKEDMINESYTVADKSVELSVHNDFVTGEQLLWLANISKTTLDIEVKHQGKRKLKGIWNCKDIESENGFQTQIAPYTVMIWKIGGTRDHDR